MSEDGLPELEEGRMLPPVNLTPQQEELCRRLDALNQKTIQGQDLSKMFKGAIFATREENRSNPDWMAQSAHSLREILYPFYTGKIRVKAAFRSYGSATIEEETHRKSLNTVYGDITKVAHHENISVENYEKLIEKFQRVLRWALNTQIDVHEQIDRFLSETDPWEDR